MTRINTTNQINTGPNQINTGPNKVNQNYQNMINEEIKEPILPIKESIDQFFNTDLLGAINNTSQRVGSAYEPEINSFEDMLKDNKYSSVTGQIFSVLPSLVNVIPPDKLSQIAVSVLIDDNVSNQVADILAKNLAKSANIFMENFNQGIQEKKQELIKEFNDLINNLSKTIGSGIGETVTNAVSDVPPVGAVMAAASAVKGLVGAVDQTIDKTEVARSTFLDIVDKTTKQFNEKYDESGMPQLVQLGKAVNRLEKLDPQAIVQAEVDAKANQLNKSAQDVLNQAAQNASKQAEGATKEVNKATQDLSNKLGPNQVNIIGPNQNIRTPPPAMVMSGGRRRLKSILKTAKRKRKNNKNTRRVRFT